MSVFKIYVKVQLVLLLFGVAYVIDMYQRKDPVTLFLLDSTRMVVARQLRLCNDECYQSWMEKSKGSEQYQDASTKIFRWVVQRPKLTKFVIRRMSEEQRDQLMFLAKLSQTNSETALIFEKTYGIKPALLQYYLSNPD
ncbi:MAG: hypothetical protein ACK5Y2_13630 [Bdellovibrionales bacterium]